MELKNTIALMISKDYKERFLAEYYQLKIRYDKLKEMCEKWDEDKLCFIPTCSKNVYKKQLKIMKEYLDILEERAVQENIPLIITDNDEVYKEVVDKCLAKLDWNNWDYFKDCLKDLLLIDCGLIVDFRSAQGRRILEYAKEKWSKKW